jgi:hypothetical protein
MNKKLLILLVLFFNVYLFQAQCAYPAAATSVGTYTFCVDGSSTTFNTANVRAGQYALVNVVSGFNYTFSVGDINNGVETENLTLFDAATDAFLVGGFNSGSNSAVVTWTSTFTGQIKILFSRGLCTNSAGSNGRITLLLNSVGNNIDDQTTFGTGNWIGHVYNWTDGFPPGGGSPASPASTNPFSASNYVGYYNVGTESFNENFGGDNVCFPVLSNGANRTNINTQTFAVRYRMRSTKAGCFLMNVNGDDGVRVYIDGVLVFDQWKEQGNTAYCNSLVNLTATSEIVLDYYENLGQNVLGFSLTPFDGSSNSISTANVRVCSGTSPGLINATTLGGCSAINSRYQWQISNDDSTFNDVTGATAEDYTPPTITLAAGETNNVRFFRRILRPFTINGGSCPFNSNSISVTTSRSIPAQPTTIVGSTTQCANTTATFTIAAVPNAVNYIWTIDGTPSGWAITQATDGLSASVVFSASASATGTIRVIASNGCGSSQARTLSITVTVTSSPSGVATQTFCASAMPTIANLSAVGTTIRWYSAPSGGTQLVSTTPLLNGAIYYATQTVNGCESFTRLAVNVNVNSLPLTGVTICVGGSGLLSSSASCAIQVPFKVRREQGEPLIL